jgi:hypothetical protein
MRSSRANVPEINPHPTAMFGQCCDLFEVGVDGVNGVRNMSAIAVMNNNPLGYKGVVPFYLNVPNCGLPSLFFYRERTRKPFARTNPLREISPKTPMVVVV